jgi:hypothetical protein
MRFSPSGFFHQPTPIFGTCFIYYISFESCSEFAELFTIETCSALWATAGKILLCRNEGLKIWVVGALVITFNIHTFFNITVPLKDMASFQNTVV